MCSYFKAGRCTKGKQCPFRHTKGTAQAATGQSPKRKKSPKKTAGMLVPKSNIAKTMLMGLVAATVCIPADTRWCCALPLVEHVRPKQAEMPRPAQIAASTAATAEPDDRNVTFSDHYKDYAVYDEDKPHDQQSAWREYKDVVFERIKPPLQASIPPGVPAKRKCIKVHKWNELKAQRNAFQIHKQAYHTKGNFNKNRDKFLRAPSLPDKNDSDSDPPELVPSSESEPDHTGRPKIPGRTRDECPKMPGTSAGSDLPTEISAKIDWSKIKQSKKRCFMVDSGASFHLTSYQCLTPEERLRVTDIKEPFELATANGIVTALHHVRLIHGHYPGRS